MKPVVFIDTNVVIDLLAKRNPFWPTALRIFDLAERSEITALISPLTLVTVYYILRNVYKVDHTEIITKFDVLTSYIQLTDVKASNTVDAMQSNFRDFEDAVLYHGAKNSPDLTDLVTRNSKHFPVTDVAICTPDEFLIKYQL